MQQGYGQGIQKVTKSSHSVVSLCKVIPPLKGRSAGHARSHGLDVRRGQRTESVLVFGMLAGTTHGRRCLEFGHNDRCSSRRFFAAVEVRRRNDNGRPNDILDLVSQCVW